MLLQWQVLHGSSGCGSDQTCDTFSYFCFVRLSVIVAECQLFFIFYFTTSKQMLPVHVLRTRSDLSMLPISFTCILHILKYVMNQRNNLLFPSILTGWEQLVFLFPWAESRWMVLEQEHHMLSWLSNMQDCLSVLGTVDTSLSPTFPLPSMPSHQSSKSSSGPSCMVGVRDWWADATPSPHPRWIPFISNRATAFKFVTS